MGIEILKTLSIQLASIAIAIAATFFFPGLSGLLISGALQFLGDLGISIYGGGLPKDPIWFITEFLTVFAPYFQEIKAAKLNFKILNKAESAVLKTEKFLNKVDDAAFESIEFLKKKTSNIFNKKSGLTQTLENEIKEVEQQELAREKFGNAVKITKKINSFTPNTKNENSWIAGVGFLEKIRRGPRDIIGDMTITYYINNHFRIGISKKPIEKIILGRTSGGEKVGKNSERYRQKNIKKRPEKVSVRKIVFKNVRYYGDYLAFIRAQSWGGYYMRRWMLGIPGKKAAINSLILFGNSFRVFSKLKALTGDYSNLFLNQKEFFKNQANKVFGKTRFGSQFNKYKGVFSKANAFKTNFAQESANEFKARADGFREKRRSTKLKKI